MLDSQIFPHILDSVVAHAPTGVLFILRATSTNLKAKADACLCTHLVLKEGLSCALDALTLWTPQDDVSDPATLNTLPITRPVTSTGLDLTPPDGRLAHVRVLDLHSPEYCVCEKCEGMFWMWTQMEARLDSLRALNSGPTPVRNIRLLRIMGEWGHNLDRAFPALLTSLDPTRVVHFLSSTRWHLVPRFHATLSFGSDVILNYSYSPKDVIFPSADFSTTGGPAGRTVFIVFTGTDECSNILHLPGLTPVFNNLAAFISKRLRAAATMEDRVVVVGIETWNPQCLGTVAFKYMGEGRNCREDVEPGASLEERFRWWINAAAGDDAARVEAGIAYATNDEFKAYINDDDEYKLIMSPSV
ncbi:hypothetical protein CcaverHIS002_0202510 [Cutaneotrichosporon cavernicola]|nr:hypothetical protein CcaverHIS002_0202510 [Cutaneotrichosporon cavernicola]